MREGRWAAWSCTESKTVCDNVQHVTLLETTYKTCSKTTRYTNHPQPSMHCESWGLKKAFTFSQLVVIWDSIFWHWLWQTARFCWDGGWMYALVDIWGSGWSPVGKTLSGCHEMNYLWSVLHQQQSGPDSLLWVKRLPLTTTNYTYADACMQYNVTVHGCQTLRYDLKFELGWTLVEKEK